MSKPIKLALLTDFSDESRVSLNTLVFNTWGFDFDLDILCITKDMNVQETEKELEQLKKELNFHLEDGHIIEAKMFLKGQEELLIKHINQENYFSLIMGIDNSEKNWRPTSINQIIYKQAKVDLSLVPLRHQVKIENRGIVALEFENLEKLYALKKSEDFFKFYYAKLKLIVISDNLLSKKDTVMILEFVSELLPELDIELINIQKINTQDRILKAVLESPIDYFIYFAEDYLDDIVNGKLEAAILPGVHKFSLNKIWLDEEFLNHIKYDDMKLPKILLKTYQEKLT